MPKRARIVPYIPVTNVGRARKFYEEKLGLTPKEEYAGGVIYECGGGSWVFMYPSAGAGTSKASTLFWAVDDVVAEVRELKAGGVVFEEYDMPGIKMENSIARAGGTKTAWSKDSEGNILAISQRVSP
jgi:predicted enzyme related to lactoylglutathione lyase